MTAIVTIGAIIAVIASAGLGAVQGEIKSGLDQGLEKYADEGYGAYQTACTYTFAAVAIAVMLIVVLAIL